MPSEVMLEEFLERDPSLLGERLLVIGRQVHTPYGKIIDLLAMDADGNLDVLELKRDKTPRDVVAQALDYGSWVATLARDEVIAIANNHLGRPFEAAFEDVFGVAPPDELNAEPSDWLVSDFVSDYQVISRQNIFGVGMAVDPRRQTFVTAITRSNDQPQVWFKVRDQDQTLKLREGDTIDVDDFRGTIAEILEHDVTIDADGERWLLSIGDSLADASAVSPER